MHLDGKRLQYFVTVADTGSLGRAAAVLHVAQPALSRQMRLLEAGVGVGLMERTPRGMVLTPAGKAFYQSARRLLDEGHAAAHGARLAATGNVGHLRVGFSEIYLWHPRVLAALQTYRAQSPAVTFTVEAMLSGAIAERVREGQLDLALAYRHPDDEEGTLQSRLWLMDDYRLVVHQDAPLARRPPRRLADLNGEDFILFRRDRSPRMYDTIIHNFHQRGFSPRIVQEGTTHYTVLALVASRLGCSVMPVSAAGRLPAGVKMLPIPDMQLHTPIHAVWRRDNLTPVVQRFVELLCGDPGGASRQLAFAEHRPACGNAPEP